MFQGLPRDSVVTCRMFKVELGIQVLITAIIDSLDFYRWKTCQQKKTKKTLPCKEGNINWCHGNKASLKWLLWLYSKHSVCVLVSHVGFFERQLTSITFYLVPLCAVSYVNCVYLNAGLQGTLVTCVLNTTILTYKSTPHSAFPPSAFLYKQTFAYSEMNEQNVVAHPFHFLVNCACCVNNACLCLAEVYMRWIGLCNQYERVHLLGVFMHGVSMCIMYTQLPVPPCDLNRASKIYSQSNICFCATTEREHLGGRICLKSVGPTCIHTCACYTWVWVCASMQVCVCAKPRFKWGL